MAIATALQRIMLGEVEVQYIDQGSGPTILLLHGAGGPFRNAPFVDLLAEHARVIAPTHPGFGDAMLPDWFESVDDLAYLYLDLMRALDLHDVILTGFSMGGWTAAEIAVKCTDRLAGLILVDSVGIKVSDRETRDIADIFATPADAVLRLTFHDIAKAPNLLALSDDELEIVARNRAASAMYLWEPYAHNPKLRRRLRRIDVPALVLWGASDGLVTPAYGRAFAASIPGATFALIAEAGHAPQLEQPRACSDRILSFVRAHADAHTAGSE